MPPLVIAAGVVAVGAVIYRAYGYISEAVGAELDALRTKQTLDTGVKLVRDPITGEYRPDNAP